MVAFNAYRTFILITRLFKIGRVHMWEENDLIIIEFTSNRTNKTYRGEGTHTCTAYKELEKIIEAEHV